MKPAPPPLRIENPCPKSWDGMTGDDKRRFCEHCQLHVHNLSAMSAPERAQFVADTTAKGHACITYELRPDGTMVTPTRWSWALRPLRALAALFAALLPFAFSACATRRTTGVPPPLDKGADNSPHHGVMQKPGKVRVSDEDWSAKPGQPGRLGGPAKILPKHPPTHG